MIPGFIIDKVVDTVGAGDGFATGVLTGLMEGLPLEKCVERACAIGAIQCTFVGDNKVCQPTSSSRPLWNPTSAFNFNIGNI